MPIPSFEDGVYIFRGSRYVHIKFADRYEANVFWYLFDNPDRPIRKEELLEKVWQVSQPSGQELRYPENYISGLRKKLGDGYFPHYSDNKGYVFLAERESIPGRTETTQADDLRRIFGHDSELRLVYSELTLSKSVMDAIDAHFMTDKEKRWSKEHFLVPTDPTYDPGLQFSGTNVACVCEVRGAAYLAHSLGSVGLQTQALAATSPEVQVELFRHSFIAVGAKSNQMTDLLLRNKSNVFVELDISNPVDPTFRSKDGKRLTPPRAEGTDYGLIIRVSPEQYPDKTWIACAGLGRAGTSGAAHFLAYNWKAFLSKMAKGGTDNFASIVQVESAPNRDGSGMIFQFVQRADQWVSYQDVKLQ